MHICTYINNNTYYYSLILIQISRNRTYHCSTVRSSAIILKQHFILIDTNKCYPLESTRFNYYHSFFLCLSFFFFFKESLM